jgi:integrase
MSVYKIKNWWWVDLSFEGKRYREKSPQNTAHDAKIYELRLRDRLVKGEPIIPVPGPRLPTFGEFFEVWFADYVVGSNKPSEQRSKRSKAKWHLLPLLGKLPLDKITPHTIERLKTIKKAEGKSPKTINNALTVLNACLKAAQEWGHLKDIPRIKWAEIEEPPFDHFSITESTQLLHAATAEPYWYGMILCALRTGMRAGELLALRWKDINIEQKTIRVARSIVEGFESCTKTKRIRTIPMTPDLVAYLSATPGRGGLVFPNTIDRPRDYRKCHRALVRICRRAGLRPVGWHTLRHTFASQLIEKDQEICAVQDCLGHTTLKMTRRYVHVKLKKLRATVAVLASDKSVAEAIALRARQRDGSVDSTGEDVGRSGRLSHVDDFAIRS